jgi:hypothetical protein
VHRMSAGAFRAAIFLAALTVVLSYNLAVVGDAGPDPASDSLEYDLLARRLADGDGFTGTKRTPVFPALLALVYRTAGPHPLAGRIFLSVLLAGSCILVYDVGRKTVGERPARWGAALACVYPPFFTEAGRLHTEVPYALLLLGVVLLLARGFERPGGRALPRDHLGAGLLLGLAALTRPAALFAVPFIPAGAALAARVRGGHAWAAAARSLLVLAIAGAVILPWSVRNTRLTGHFVPLSTLGGTVLLGANNPVEVAAPGGVNGTHGWNKGGWVPPQESGLLSADEVAGLDAMTDVERDRLFRRRALEYIAGHPMQMIVLAGHKMIRLLDLVPPVRHGAGRLELAAYYAVLLAAVTGLSLSRGRLAPLIPLGILTGTVLLMTAVTWGGPRFRHAMEPAFLLLAGVAVARGEERLRGPRSRPADPSGRRAD